MLVVRQNSPSIQKPIFLAVRGGLKTLIDSDLHDFLSTFKWFPLKSAATTYVVARRIVHGKTYTVRLHRLITQAPDYMKVHHINHDSFDNRRENLRLVTEREHRHFDGWHIFHRD